MSAPSPSPANSPLPGRFRVVAFLPGALAFVFFAYLATLPAITSRWLDFPVYWVAGEKARLGLTVYDVSGHFQYKYSPFIALAFGKTFGALDFATASLVFQKAMLAVWIVVLLRLARGNTANLLVLVLFFGNALRLDLELGQLNAIVLGILLALAHVLSRPARLAEDVGFGVVFSLAIQLKLFALVLVPLLVFRREWRKLVSVAIFLPLISVGILAARSGWAFAWAENRAWIGSLTHSTDALIDSQTNVAVLGTASRIFGIGMGTALWLFAGAGFAAYLLRNHARPIRWLRDRLLYAVALFNPLVWSYWILFAMPLFASHVDDFRDRLRRGGRVVQVAGGFAVLFIFAAFNGQHARWAWNGGILTGLLLFGGASRGIDAIRTSRAGDLGRA